MKKNNKYKIIKILYRLYYMIKTYNNDDVIENYENFKPQNVVKNKITKS